MAYFPSPSAQEGAWSHLCMAAGQREVKGLGGSAMQHTSCTGPWLCCGSSKEPTWLLFPPVCLWRAHTHTEKAAPFHRHCLCATSTFAKQMREKFILKPSHCQGPFHLSMPYPTFFLTASICSSPLVIIMESSEKLVAP